MPALGAGASRQGSIGSSERGKGSTAVAPGRPSAGWRACRPAGSGRGRRSPGRCAPAGSSVARTVATGRPVAATNSSTVASPATRQVATRPAVGRTQDRRACPAPATPGGRERTDGAEVVESCGIPATIRASFGNSRRNARQPADSRSLDNARDQEALTALFEGPRRGDEGATPRRRFDDDRSVGQAADDTVPARERAIGRAACGGELGHDRAAARPRSRRPTLGAPAGTASRGRRR